MKSHLIAIAAVGLTLAACNGGGQTQEAQFATDSLYFGIANDTIDMAIIVDYPTAGPQQTVNAIREHISERLGGTFAGDLTDGKAVTDHYGQAVADDLRTKAKEFGEDMTGPLCSSNIIELLTQTDQYITYTVRIYNFFGGAHGIYRIEGMTFRKSDGRHVDFDMLRNTDSEAFHELIKDGLKQYFISNGETIDSDEDLAQWLATDAPLTYLPLPVTPPYLTEQGLVLTYQNYEIAPYAAGEPTFTIAYDKLEPYMTHTLKQLAGGQTTP